MKGCPSLRFLAVIVAVACVALVAGSAFAQYQTGNIYGKVQAKDGSALPGVTVTLTGVGAPQSNVTDSLGNFRFINLAPGTYSLKAELAGYGTATRVGLTARVGQSSDVTMTMNPAVAESIRSRRKRRCSISARPARRPTFRAWSWRRFRPRAIRGPCCSRFRP